MAGPPHVRSVTPPLAAKPFDADDPRALALVQGKIPRDAVPRLDATPVHLIGVPFDGAVTGRKGAAEGPAGIRAAFRYFGTYDVDNDTDIAGLDVTDQGDLEVSADTATVHARLAEAVAWSLRSGALPMVMGGDNSLSYGALAGLARTRPGRIGIIVVDAHYDVRATKEGVITSGTPYRRILTELTGLPGQVAGRDLVEVGIRALANSRHHAKVASDLGIQVISAAEVHERGIRAVTSDVLSRVAGVDHLWFSLDMDGIDPAHAPGVSAPIPGGLATNDLLHLVRRAAQERSFAGIDVTETAPPLDPTGNTSRVAALALLTAMSGLVQRDLAKDT
jgi:formimidoylglutamase